MADDLEPRLERFLAKTAKPIPVQTLDNVIAAIPRTRQERRLDATRWLRGLAPVLGTAAAVVLVAVALTLGQAIVPASTPSIEPGSPELVWNVYADYVAAPGANPAPDRAGNAEVWSYQYGVGSGHEPAAYVLMPDFRDGMWFVAGFDNLNIYPQYTGLVLHPYGAAGSGAERRPIVTWRSPISGTIRVVGRFELINASCVEVGDGIEAFVDRGAETLWTADLPSGGGELFDLETTVLPGSTLSFVVDPGGFSDCDSTLLFLRIVTG